MQTTTLQKNKSDLRKDAINKRNFMAKTGMMEKISTAITKNILNSIDYKNANNIALYYPIKNEVDITGIISNKKNFYLPKCKNNEMSFHKIDSIDNLEVGMYNIMEAKGEMINPEYLDIVYIPALLANKRNYRLGYGKGFYDRFFAQNKTKAKKTIVIPSCFICDVFFEDEYDYKLDEILSENMLNVC